MSRHKVKRPIIVSECACWLPHLPDQMAIMDRVMVALEQGSIEAAAWYSSHDPFGPLRGADLLDAHGNLTLLGEHYRQLMDGERTPDLKPQVSLPVVMA
jgi:hypothetical protein